MAGVGIIAFSGVHAARGAARRTPNRTATRHRTMGTPRPNACGLRGTSARASHECPPTASLLDASRCASGDQPLPAPEHGKAGTVSELLTRHLLQRASDILS